MPSRKSLVRTPSKNPSQYLPHFTIHRKTPSKNPSKNLLESNLEKLLRTLLRRAYCGTTPLVHPLPGVRSLFSFLVTFWSPFLTLPSLSCQNPFAGLLLRQGDSRFAGRKQIEIASHFWGYPQNRRKLAATMAASRRNRVISLLQRAPDTKHRMQAVKWVVAKLQGDKTASFCRKTSGRKVTER